MAITVTATMSGAAANEHIYLWIRVLTGATEAGGASVTGLSATGGTTVSGSVTPNATNSLICWTGSADNPGTVSGASNNTVDSSTLDGDDWQAIFGRFTGTVTSGTPVTAGANITTSDYTTWAIYEVRPSGGSTPAVDGSSPALASATGAGIKTVTSASFTPPAGSVIVAMVVGGGTGTSGAFTMAVSGGGLTWTQQAGNATVADQDSFVFTATVGGGGTTAVAAWPARPGKSRLQHHHGARRQQLQQVFPNPNASPVAGTASATAAAANPPVGPAYITGIVGASGGNPGYFTDNAGKPKLVWGDALWALCGNVGRWSSGAWQSDYDTINATRAGQGFTVIYTKPMGTQQSGNIDNNGGTFDSLFPFQGGTPSTGVAGANPSTGLTSSYWARIDYFLNSALAQGITVFFNAIGYDSDFSSGPGPLFGKSTTEFQAYGAALGARYASQPNLIWHLADDYFGENDSLITAFMTGVRGAGDTHLVSIENNPETTSRLSVDGNNTHQVWGFSNAQYNFVYSYNVIYYGTELAYTADGTVPVIAGDGYFYQGSSTYFANFDRSFRQDSWHALSSGARGKVHGSESTWQWQSTAQASAASDWFFANNAKNIRTVMEGLAGWQNLIPDTSSSFITAGRGTHASAFASGGGGGQYEPAFTDSYVTGSITADGTLALVYLSHGSTITVNTALLATGWAATWIDPVTGATSSAGSGPSFNSTAKGNNSQGDPDWVLAFQSTAVNATASAGLASATGAAQQAVAAVTATGTGNAAATGAAFLPANGRVPGAAAATGAAQQAVAAVTGLPGAAMATGAAQQGVTAVTATGTGSAAGTGAGQQPVAAVTATGTGNAAGTGAAFAPGTARTPGAATATGAAQQPVAAVTATGTGSAAATGAGQQPVAAVTAFDATGALATGTSYNPSVTTGGNATASAGLASAAGAAQAPVAQVTALPAAAAGTGAAQQGVIAVTGTGTGAAAATGVAQQAVAAVTATGTGNAAGTGTSYNPSVTTGGNATANAGLAAAAAAGQAPAALVTVLPSAAAAAGTGQQPSAAVTATGTGAAAGTGAGQQAAAAVTATGTGAGAAAGAAAGPAPQVTALPGAALATSAALQPAVAVTVFPATAAATGTALNPSVTTGGDASVNAGLAAAAGAAQQAAAAVTATGTGNAAGTGAAFLPANGRVPGAASAAGAAQQAVTVLTALPGGAAANGLAQQATGVIIVFAGRAAASGTAQLAANGRVPGAASATGNASASALSLTANAQAAAALAASLQAGGQGRAAVVKGGSTGTSVTEGGGSGMTSTVGETAGTGATVTSAAASSGGVT